jgi:hypothetical protein
VISGLVHTVRASIIGAGPLYVWIEDRALESLTGKSARNVIPVSEKPLVPFTELRKLYSANTGHGRGLICHLLSNEALKLE